MATPLIVTTASLGVVVVLGLVARPPVAAFGILEKIAFVLPGLLLIRAVAGPAAGWLPVVAFGPCLGFGLSSLTLLALWVSGGRGSWTLFLAPLMLGPLVPLARRLRGRWPFPVTRPQDGAALAAALLLVPLVVAAPFAHVGETLPEGKAYRAYFTADYVWRRAVVAELAKGDVLPVNPFYTRDALHYYWLPHLPSAVTYRTGIGDLDEVLLVHSTLVDVAFVAFLFGLARWFVARPWAAALGVVTVIMASSYEGLYALWDLWRQDAPLSLVRYLNIDSVSRWHFQSLPIDGLQRVLFYQPHHAIGYALGFMGVMAVAGRVKRLDVPAMVVGGVLLGLSTVVSSFAGLMLTCVAALWEACSVLRWRDWWRASVHLVAAAVPLVLAADLVTALRYVDTGGSVLSLGPNPLAAHNVWTATVLSFGPVLLVSLLAGWAIWRARDASGFVFAALSLTCVVFYFFVDIRDHQDVYVGWRVGHLWFIASTALAAIAYQWIGALPGVWRGAVTGLVGAAVLAALPTSLIDIYNTQDIYNWAQGPGFTWTLLLSPDEWEAFAWIKSNTPADAVFQLDAQQRDAQGWAYLPAFAERRMAVGLPISMVPLRKYQEGSSSAAWIFESSTAEGAHALAIDFGVQYLFLGRPERRAHPAAQARLDAAPEFFERVFQNREVAIYRVRPVK